MSSVRDWGPSHQTAAKQRSRAGWKWGLRAIIALAIVGLLHGATHGESSFTIAAGGVWLVVLTALALPGGVQRRMLAPLRRHKRSRSGSRVNRRSDHRRPPR